MQPIQSPNTAALGNGRGFFRAAKPRPRRPCSVVQAGVYAFLRSAHTLLAFLFFATTLLHVGAALFHALIRQDGVFSSMAGRWSR
jgi:cytochrome b561